MPAAFEPLEQIRAAKTFEAYAGTRQVAQDLDFIRRGRFMRRGLLVVTEAVARQREVVDGLDDIIREQTRILIAGVLGVNRELDSLGNADGEIGACAIGEHEVLSIFRGIGRGIVFLDKAACAPDEIQTHQVAPVIGKITSLKSRE